MIAVASLIVLIAVIAFSAVTKKNAGVVGLVAAYIFSLAAAKCGTEINVSKVVTGNWPTSVFFIVLATTFLFGIATLTAPRRHFPRTSYVSQEETRRSCR